MTHIAHINPIRYRSYYYDRETGLYYLQTRYYDPEVGRFINADAFKYLGADGPIHGMNLYAYCGNNPVMNSDPTGCVAREIIACVVTTAIMINDIYQLANNEEGELKFGLVAIYGYSISIDILWILEWLRQ